MGVEPIFHSEHDFKSCAYTNFATRAMCNYTNKEMLKIKRYRGFDLKLSEYT